MGNLGSLPTIPIRCFQIVYAMFLQKNNLFSILYQISGVYLYNIWTVVSLGRNLKTDCEEKYIFYYGNSIVFCCNVKLRYPIQPSHSGILKLLFQAKAEQFLRNNYYFLYSILHKIYYHNYVCKTYVRIMNYISIFNLTQGFSKS